MTGVLAGVTIVAALGCALIAGVFFAFSNFIMRALARLEPPVGVAAMQSINVVVINPLFMIALFGTGLIGAVLGVWAVVGDVGGSAPYLLAGAALYLVGTVGVTMAYNVPRNNALAELDPQRPRHRGALVGVRLLVDGGQLCPLSVRAPCRRGVHRRPPRCVAATLTLVPPVRETSREAYARNQLRAVDGFLRAAS